MTVSDLKEYLNRFDDRADIFYFDRETGEDIPLKIDWLTIEDSFEDMAESEDMK
jgi:hypothetical protein